MQRTRHVRRIAALLDDPELCQAISTGQGPPRDFGRRLSERSIEYPWLWPRLGGGALLDAGGSLNHPFTVRRLPASVESMVVVTLALEPEVDDARVTYRWADLRDVPLPGAAYDVVVCVSTLEHVGMDLSGFGLDAARSRRPQDDALIVMRQLRRLLKPGGRLLLTVPCGRRQEIGSMRQITRRDFDELTEAFGPVEPDTRIFVYDRSGWRLGTWSEAELRGYRDRRRELVSRDGAVGARAVACSELRSPA